MVGNNREAHKQLGNAVPSALAEELGRQIRRQLFDHPVDPVARLLPKPAGEAPPPERPSPVETLPERILRLAGNHRAHPGTGRGPGASSRAALSEKGERPRHR